MRIDKTNPWHKVSIGERAPEVVNAIIEIPKYTRAKYELDKESGMLLMDRVIFSSMYYPANYGFIPRTYCDDKDPLDILVLSQIQIVPMCLVSCKVIGVLQMLDDGEKDDKIIAVAENDMSVNFINDMEDEFDEDVAESWYFDKEHALEWVLKKEYFGMRDYQYYEMFNEEQRALIDNHWDFVNDNFGNRQTKVGGYGANTQGQDMRGESDHKEFSILLFQITATDFRIGGWGGIDLQFFITEKELEARVFDRIFTWSAFS